MRRPTGWILLLGFGAGLAACEPDQDGDEVNGGTAGDAGSDSGGRGSASGGRGSETGGRGAASGGSQAGGRESTTGGEDPANGGAETGGRETTSGGDGPGTGGRSATGGVSGTGGRDPATGGSTAHAGGGPAAGNPDGECDVPAEAAAEDTSSPDHLIGDGTPESCTSEAVVSTIALGGIITFDCGPDPLTITLDETAMIHNDTGPEIVIDGGGLITLSGGGERRILYMNTCDESLTWLTDHCQDQEEPRLTLQNLTFIDGDSTGDDTEGGGGGAVFVRGGRVKVVNSRFFNNVCDPDGPDLGGAGLRVLSQYHDLPVYVVGSTFGGAEGYGNVCSNGGGVSSIGVSWTILNSLFSHNRAIGNGGNPAESGTPGGGSGGAIYNDGNMMTLKLCGTRIEHNEVNAYGSAIFFVTNDHSGNIVIDQSVITNNIGGSWYPEYPQLSHHDDTPVTVTDSIIE